MGAKLKDIAAQLGYSVNTISRALRDMPDISEDTKKKVRLAAEDLGYRRNLAASRLRTNRSQIIGLVVADIGNPVFAGMVRGAEKVCKVNGYTMMLGNSNENPEEEEAVVAGMLEHGIDGLLLVPCMKTGKIIGQIKQAGIPFVILGRKFPHIPTSVVKCDDFGGAYDLARRLYELGHRKFLYISGPPQISPSKERFEGFRTFLAEKGLPADEPAVVTGDGTRQGGRDSMRQLLAAAGGKLAATAIFCFSDYMALGVYSALREAGLAVPGDISVAGFDNNEFADMMSPPLTTVDIHIYALGEKAAQMLIGRIAGKDDLQEIVEPTQLIERQSTGRAPE